MCRVMVTAARAERLKIVTFLLRLAGWDVQSSASLQEAVNYMKNHDNNESYFDLLVVVDYGSLGEEVEDRLFECQCLEVCNGLQRPVSILISGNDMDPMEKNCLSELTYNNIAYCHSEKLVARIEQYHDQISLNSLHMAR